MPAMPVNPQPTPPLRRVPAVDRAARMLAILAQERTALSLSELARRLDASKGSVRDILETLRDHGLVDRDDGSKLYQLGGGLIRLGALTRSRLGVGETSRPFLRALAEETGEVAVLAAIQVDRLVVSQTAEPEQRSLPMNVHATPGAAIPLLAGACGKVLLAFAPGRHELRDVVSTFDPAELASVRAQGYAVDDEEYLLGIRGVSAPVIDGEGEITALILVSGLSASFPRERLEAFGRATAAAARTISAALGAPPVPDDAPASPVVRAP